MDRPVVLGHVSGLFGSNGRIKVYSYTRPRDNILEFAAWSIGRPGAWRCFSVVEAQAHGKALIARLADAQGVLADRDTAAQLLDCDIAVARAAMPALPAGQYYWCDLVGLEVVNRDGVVLGCVESLIETGANDVLVVAGDRQRLVPFVAGEIIDAIDLEGGRIVADWDPDF